MAVFDALADSYDDEFTRSPIAQYLRDKIHQRLHKHFKSGQHILELGCGTGEDAHFLAQHGIQVTATDTSEKMLHIAAQKNAASDLVTTQQLNLANLPDQHNVIYDGVFSNFGVLNCLTDWTDLATWLASHTKSGVIVGFGVMSPYCAWEFLWHAFHWEWDIALRRVRGSQFQPDDSSQIIDITYPTIKRLSNDLAPHFKRVFVMPLGLALPPSGLFDVLEKRPKLLDFFMGIEDKVERLSALSLFADHYWIEFERI